MNKQILVPLRQHDRIEDVLPCVERVAQPGMKVVFLLGYPVEGFTRHLALYTQLEGGLSQRTAAARHLANIYSWEGNLRRAESRVSPAREALERMGAEVAVEAYAGSLNKAVAKYAAKGEVHLIITPAGIGNRISRFLSGTIFGFQVFKRRSFSRAVLIHPCTEV